MRKQRTGPCICRGSMGYQCIVNIKQKPPVTLLIQSVKINHIRRIQIFVWKKTIKHSFLFL